MLCVCVCVCVYVCFGMCVCMCMCLFVCFLHLGIWPDPAVVERSLPPLPPPTLDPNSNAMLLPAADLLDEAGKALARLLKFMFRVERDRANLPTTAGAPPRGSSTVHGSSTGTDGDGGLTEFGTWLTDEESIGGNATPAQLGFKVAELLSPWGLSTQNPKVWYRGHGSVCALLCGDASWRVGCV